MSYEGIRPWDLVSRTHCRNGMDSVSRLWSRWAYLKLTILYVGCVEELAKGVRSCRSHPLEKCSRGRLRDHLWTLCASLKDHAHALQKCSRGRLHDHLWTLCASLKDHVIFLWSSSTSSAVNSLCNSEIQVWNINNFQPWWHSEEVLFVKSSHTSCFCPACLNSITCL